MATLVFDVNVVPPSDHDPDYEEVFKQQKDAEGGMEELVNGKPSEKGYYVDENAKTDMVRYIEATHKAITSKHS